MERVSFDQADVDNALANMDDRDLDNLAFGAVQVDAQGKILAYNAAESDITGRQAGDVIGKNFFEEVAPCTKSPEFQGKFKEGVEKGELDAMFEYTFDYNMQPTKVKVHMKKALVGESFWILVKRI
ncbi:photoactive yellow protein [Thiohalorhabdus methylotrophus]|uniref:Photoactive yellow protein n=1 Tax=Thiohalorhabdus methylotrophus TaxID=3242694 RepID=A0ABV4TQ95_9GAMM